MEFIAGYQNILRSFNHPVITIGNFDGVHLGHLRIIETALAKARALNGQCIAYTFRPHPQAALRPGIKLQLLSTYEERRDLLAQAGIDITIEEPFSREFSTVAPEQFFNDVLLRKVGAEAIVVGYDFAFGKERTGHLAALEAFCKSASVELTVVSPHREGGEIISSSKIREHLLAGEIENANRLLGREFFYKGVVIKGEGRGRKIGFPTANLKLDDKLALPYGVYSTWAVLGDQIYPSVTNVGVRPTFQVMGEELLPALVETHLLDTTIDLYGSALEVRFIRKIRNEEKFSGIDALKKQIALDVTQSRKDLKK